MYVKIHTLKGNTCYKPNLIFIDSKAKDSVLYATSSLNMIKGDTARVVI